MRTRAAVIPELAEKVQTFEDSERKHSLSTDEGRSAGEPFGVKDKELTTHTSKSTVVVSLLKCEALKATESRSTVEVTDLKSNISTAEGS